MEMKLRVCVCVSVYLPEHSVCGCRTNPELGHSGRDREDGGENEHFPHVALIHSGRLTNEVV